MENPLFAYNELPKYDEITPDVAEEAILILLDQAKSALVELEETASATWDGCMKPKLELAEPLTYAWGIVSHMLSAMNSEAWRAVHEKLQPQVVSFFSNLGQNQILFNRMTELRDSDQYKDLSEAQKRILESDMRDAMHAGAACSPEKRAALTKLREQNAADSATFMNHALDASKVVVLALDAPQDIKGLPTSLLTTASEAAQRNGYPDSSVEKGPWVITPEAPLYVPFMQYSERRDLREELYRAYVTRASDGEVDNKPILQNIIKRRQEMAKLLEKKTYADLTLEGRMARSVVAVNHLIDRITSVAKPAAEKDYAALCAYAAQNSASEPIAAWDVSFWAERMRKERFAIDNEMLRSYFPLPHVLDCLFLTVLELFGVTIEPADGEVAVWHPDVRFFSVKDEQNQVIAHLYLDPYSRPESKRGGAWMDSVLSRSRLSGGKLRLPAALMVCNQSRPTPPKPALMTLNEVQTLYHECGHALQHILTEVDEADAAGVNNVEWDAVELPSQFMENWMYHKPFLKRMTKHVDTGEPLPDELIDQIIASRWFLAGYQSLRQMFFSALDMGLHAEYDPNGEKTPDAYKMEISPDYCVIPPLEEDRFLCCFSHIFAGGYAAGYYSYKWAEVLAADAFSAFEEEGLQSPQTLSRVGKRFRKTVLALGGSKHPMEVFELFRGRQPDPDTLLKQAGLLS